MSQSKKFEFKLLSVVIPAFKQEKTILKDVKSIKKTLDTLGCMYEIIVVIDGQVDNTHNKILKHRIKNVRAISYPINQGKGHAVRTGMLAAKGDIVGFIDAGMDIHPTGFTMLLSHMEWYNADIIVGSKLHPVSKVNYPFYRKVLSWGYRLITYILFGFKVRDTQVGLKFFKRKVIEKVLPRLLVKTYAFDIEILAVSYALGYKRIFEAPVNIHLGKSNTISFNNLSKIVLLMLWDTAAVFYRLKIIRYYNKQRSVNRKQGEKVRKQKAANNNASYTYNG